MCGIAGVISDRRFDAPGVGRAMADALHHRGPDSAGVLSVASPNGAPAGVLAHTRLAVIDLSDDAAQPFLSEDGQVALVFNGEIYEFRALRRRLEAKGFVFRSQSDTEVILATYLIEGIEGLHAIDGMFAFAIWDQRGGDLIVARDRAGKKPVYWTKIEGGGIAFASEAKALRAVPGFDLDLNPSALPEYLTFGYVPTPRTIFRGVRRLPPASLLRFRIGGEPSIARYERVGSLDPLRVSVQEAKQLVREAVGRAVARRLVADVPVGAFLSGGIDSSVVVAEMAARSSKVRTFAVGFDDDSTYDETRYARAVAQQFGTEHTELRLRPNAEEMFDRLLYHHDEPYGDSSALAVHAISAATREHVTVVLTGDGGDEVFAGYTRFQGGLLQGWLPSLVGRGARRVLRRMPEPRGYKNPLALARRFVEHSGRSADEQLLAWNAYFAGPNLGALLRPDVFSELDPWLPITRQARLLNEAREAGYDRLGQILRHNFETYLLDDLLVKTDRMTMAVGLEARSPFLDSELVNLAFRLPSDMKLRRGQLKWILREAYRGVLGPEVLDRKKHGFGVPVSRWWSGPLEALVQELLGGSARLHEYLRAEAVAKLLEEHRSGARDHGQRIFALVQLELFLRGRGLSPLASAASST